MSNRLRTTASNTSRGNYLRLDQDLKTQIKDVRLASLLATAIVVHFWQLSSPPLPTSSVPVCSSHGCCGVIFVLLTDVRARDEGRTMAKGQIGEKFSPIRLRLGKSFPQFVIDWGKFFPSKMFWIADSTFLLLFNVQSVHRRWQLKSYRREASRRSSETFLVDSGNQSTSC